MDYIDWAVLAFGVVVVGWLIAILDSQGELEDQKLLIRLERNEKCIEHLQSENYKLTQQMAQFDSTLSMLKLAQSNYGGRDL